MKILKLHEINTNSEKITREITILFNPLEIITVDDYSFSNGYKGGCIKHKAGNLYTRETLDDIYNMINGEEKVKINSKGEVRCEW